VLCAEPLISHYPASMSHTGSRVETILTTASLAITSPINLLQLDLRKLALNLLVRRSVQLYDGWKAKITHG
jgi:hypothetical protein